jgi:small-conductance mechanosensitive channel
MRPPVRFWPAVLQANPLDAIATGAHAAAASAPDAVRLFGITLIGATPHNLHKLILTAAFIAVAFVIAWTIRSILKLFIGSRSGTQFQFWAKQGVSLVVAAILMLGIMSIWFDNPARLAAFLGLVGAGLAFALQRVITAVAGYFVILRGKTFNVGDRIVMGGVRGDVIGLSFMQTRIMEMGVSPKEAGDDPSWVRSRQFTGRIVTVTNDKVFDEPVYNYTHEFPYIWDEISVPIQFHNDYDTADRIIIEAARRHAMSCSQVAKDETTRLKERFGLEVSEIDPRSFWRITEDWLELTVRYLAPDHGGRAIKDAIGRDVLAGLDEAGIVIGATRQEALPGPREPNSSKRAR